MSEERVVRINKVLRELNISLERAVDYLKDKGIAIDANPNAKISDAEYSILQNEFAGDKGNKAASLEVSEEKRKEKEALRIEREKEIEDKRKADEERQRLEVIKAKATVSGPIQVGTIDLDPKKSPATPAAQTPTKETAASKKPAAQAAAESPAVDPSTEATEEAFTTQYQKLSGATLTGQTIDLSQFNKPKKKKEEPKIVPNKPGDAANKNKRKRIPLKPGEVRPGVPGAANPNKISPNSPGDRSSRPGFVMMDVPITKVIGTCMSLGIMVTMNQRLDAETLTIVADEFGFDVEFITTDLEESIQVVEDAPEDLLYRAPIVTVMGHVDHGKTSLLDYIRKENVIAGESGGITQHIGAYGVTLDNGQKIAFLDTPGHEAFTAMRARGAQVTDIAIIVIAADDDIMPQTKEAISHAQAANVPIIFAINKIDKPNANPEKIKERLAGMNLLVEDWGGKIQSHDISAKAGTGVKELLEKVLLEAEILDLKSNPNKLASGTVVEAFLDKGKGYVSTILVQNGTLKIGDYMLAGKHQ